MFDTLKKSGYEDRQKIDMANALQYPYCFRVSVFQGFSVASQRGLAASDDG
jgi:hypothetical protein